MKSLIIEFFLAAVILAAGIQLARMEYVQSILAIYLSIYLVITSIDNFYLDEETNRILKRIDRYLEQIPIKTSEYTAGGKRNVFNDTRMCRVNYNPAIYSQLDEQA